MIVPREEFEEYLEMAEKISPDPDDFMYFALALKLKCPIWSNDKELKKQNKVIIYSTEDLTRELEF
jgi:predicted nucleic acid-binding protein